MAAITKQGRGYKITVTNGTDINGRKLRSHMTWVPSEGMTPKQIGKELQRQSVLFEEHVRHTAIQSGNIRLVDFTALFMREHAYPNLKANTILSYENKAVFINQALGHIKLKDLKPGHIASFYANLGEDGMHRSGGRLLPGTIRTYHQVLSAILSRAVKWGYIQNNPATRVDIPSNAGHKAAYLDEADARRMLELLHNEPIRWRALITFGLLSGLRRGELLGLRWQDVNFDDQTVTVRQTSNYTPGKGVYTDNPKTANSHRPLRLSRSALMLLLEYKRWQDQRRESLGNGWQETDSRVFTDDTGALIPPNSLSRWFSAFMERTDLPKITIHSLRHTYASLMIAEGVPLVVVANNLGHAQVSTTANIYAHVIKSAEARAAQVFDKFSDIVELKKAARE